MSRREIPGRSSASSTTEPSDAATASVVDHATGAEMNATAAPPFNAPIQALTPASSQIGDHVGEALQYQWQRLAEVAAPEHKPDAATKRNIILKRTFQAAISGALLGAPALFRRALMPKEQRNVDDVFSSAAVTAGGIILAGISGGWSLIAGPFLGAAYGAYKAITKADQIHDRHQAKAILAETAKHLEASLYLEQKVTTPSGRERTVRTIRPDVAADPSVSQNLRKFISTVMVNPKLGPALRPRHFNAIEQHLAAVDAANALYATPALYPRAGFGPPPPFVPPPTFMPPPGPVAMPPAPAPAQTHIDAMAPPGLAAMPPAPAEIQNAAGASVASRDKQEASAPAVASGMSAPSMLPDDSERRAQALTSGAPRNHERDPSPSIKPHQD